MASQILLGKRGSSILLIPTSIFLDRTLSVLEAMVEYLKDDKGLSYHETAVLLNRNDRTILTSYNRVKIKRRAKVRVIVGSSWVLIPTVIFRDRRLSVLEVLVKYLKEEKNLSYHMIAVLLNRDDRTIWTCYHRAEVKLNN